MLKVHQLACLFPAISIFMGQFEIREERLHMHALFVLMQGRCGASVRHVLPCHVKVGGTVSTPTRGLVSAHSQCAHLVWELCVLATPRLD